MVADCSLVDLDLVDLALVEPLTNLDLGLVEVVTADVDLVGLVLACFFLPPVGCLFSFSLFFCSLSCLYLATKSSSVMQTATLL